MKNDFDKERIEYYWRRDPAERNRIIESFIDTIEGRAREFGLAGHPQEFTIVSEERSKELLAYTGIVPRYTHWSFGKAYDRFETFYKYGVISHLPYEMVINSSPCEAFLLEGNSPTVQLMVIAHVYAHNDFFKNNVFFSETHPQEERELFSDHADYVGKLIERYGLKKIEDALTAAHGIRAQRLSLPGSEGHQSGLNLIRFLLEECPRLTRPERDVLRIVDEEWEYFVPQVETKIMNEGWAAYWHTKIIESLDLPASFMLDFITENANIAFAIPMGGMNPYNIGMTMFRDIEANWDRMKRGESRRGEKWDGLSGQEKIFEVRGIHKDNTFVENYLTIDAARACHLVKYDESDEREVVAVSDEEGFEEVRDAFSRQVGSRLFPIVRALDPNYRGKSELLSGHEFDGRHLDLEYLKKTLEHLYAFWKEPVYLETVKDIEVTLPHTSGGRTISNVPYCYAFDGKKHWDSPVQTSRNPAIDTDMKILNEFFKGLVP